VRVFGVQAAAGPVFDDAASDLVAFREQTGATFPFLLEEDAASYQAYRDAAIDVTTPYPLDVLIDGSGIVRYLRGDYDDAALREALDTWCD
jgi:hypothetical protein